MSARNDTIHEVRRGGQGAAFRTGLVVRRDLRGGALFRADATADRGLGHLQRCLSLAAALDQLGMFCTFLSIEDHTANRVVTDSGFGCRDLSGVEIGSDQDLTQTIEMASRHGCDCVVIDSYDLGPNYMERMRAAGFFVVAIDDLALLEFPCQLVVNGGAHARKLRYRSSFGDTRFLLGPEYALLRPEFWKIPDRKVRESVRNIYVALGGADGRNLTPRLLSLLDSLAEEFSISVVVGPFFKNIEEIKMIAEGCQHPVRVLDRPRSVRDIMLESDLAICSGGQTLCELAATGTPTVTIQVADNQSGNIGAMADAGAVRVGGIAGEPGLEKNVRTAVLDLLQDSNQRLRMSMVGRRLIDGRGAPRVAEIITSRRLHIQRHHE